MRARDLLAVAVTKARDLIKNEQEAAKDMIEAAAEEDRRAGDSIR